MSGTNLILSYSKSSACLVVEKHYPILADSLETYGIFEKSPKASHIYSLNDLQAVLPVGWLCSYSSVDVVVAIGRFVQAQYEKERI